jgi:integrase
VRDILKQIYGFAILHGEKVANPADEVGPASIASFVPKDRSLSPTAIRVMLKQLEHVATLPTIRLGMRLYLLTMVRKSELQDAVWAEVDFEKCRLDDSEGENEAIEGRITSTRRARC